LLALDAYRGFIMIALAASGFGFARLKGHPVWGVVAHQFDHVDWEGGVFWDMIQPAFMFMVGVAMPFALARRMERGATFAQNLKHVAARSLRLLVLSQILISVSDGKLQFQLINVLCQIAFTYFLCFLIMQLEWRWQAVAAALLLAAHWTLFLLFPGRTGHSRKHRTSAT
jgi:predicted acyltransferase